MTFDDWAELKNELENCYRSFSGITLTDKDVGMILNKLTELQNKINKKALREKDILSGNDKKSTESTLYNASSGSHHPYAKSPEYNPELMKKLKKVSVKV